ncbi:MAG: superoxide dismutase, Ni [Xanthomonadales bacterium]|nr:superoxide dismutase, Ni [Xanthomonadales bacterium]
MTQKSHPMRARLTPQTASAHCDIPCAIYDPSEAIIGALSVLRIMDIMIETAAKEGAEALAKANTIGRCVLRKEQEAERVKHEIRIIWGDYFKGGHLETHPHIHGVAHAIMVKASACKQEVNRQDALDLLELVNQFAEAFWQTKNVASERKVCPYPPAEAVVYPIL